MADKQGKFSGQRALEGAGTKGSEGITVEVAYATPERQLILEVKVERGTSMMDAILQSNLLNEFPGIDLTTAKMGMFGKLELKPKERILEPGDRVEVYRPLIADPKEIRKKRAEKVQQEKK